MSDAKPSQDDRAPAARCLSIDWYAEGEARTVEVAGVRIVVRFIGPGRAC